MRIVLFLIGFITVFSSGPVVAEQSPFRSTSYPLPRFVSLSKSEVNVRTGPGKKFPIKWVYRKKKLPVEIILEYGPWRKVKDSEGETGWVHQTLLSGERTGIVTGESSVNIFRKNRKNSEVTAILESGVLVDVSVCKTDWCKVGVEGYRGWVERKFIWGVYENENFD